MTIALDLSWSRAVPAVKRFLARDPKHRDRIFVPARCTIIDDTVLAAWRTQWQGKRRFNWADNQERARAHDVWFEFALWSDSVLCGVAFGVPGKPHVAIDMGVESMIDLINLEAPESHPLKGAVAAYTIMTLTAFAHLQGFAAVRVENPINDVVRGLYCRLGMRVYDGHPGRPCLRRII